MWENIVIRLNRTVRSLSIIIMIDNTSSIFKHHFLGLNLEEIDPSLISAYYFSEFSGCITRFVSHLKLTVKLNKSCVHIRISNYNNI